MAFDFAMELRAQKRNAFKFGPDIFWSILTNVSIPSNCVLALPKSNYYFWTRKTCCAAKKIDVVQGKSCLFFERVGVVFQTTEFRYVCGISVVNGPKFGCHFLAFATSNTCFIASGMVISAGFA